MEKAKSVNLSKLSRKKLLSLRFCDLGLKIKGTWLEECINQLYRELGERNINFRPHCYLSDEWLCPDGEPVIGIAFYLAHPRLMKLEGKMMLEVEGGDKTSCMRLLRHEMGHVINYAYFLYRRKQWKKLFGSFSADYPEKYKYRPYSKRFVRHLEEWYAQYHPDEDFAETFAVWLDPASNWMQKYKGWKALEKLEYIDSLMKEVSAKPPLKPNGEIHWDVTSMKALLSMHYKRRRKFYAEDYPDFHDFHLKKIFPRSSSREPKEKAFKLIRKHRKEILDSVALWTGEKKYIINDLLKELIGRCRELGLKAGRDEAGAVLKMSVYITAQIMNYLYTGRYKEKK